MTSAWHRPLQFGSQLRSMVGDSLAASGFSQPFFWTVLLLNVVLVAAVVASHFHLSNNLIVMWMILLVLGVIVHEFGHAFQSKLRGHDIKEPAVLWLYLGPRQLIAIALLWFAFENLVNVVLVLAAVISTSLAHPYFAEAIWGMGWQMTLGYLLSPPVPAVAAVLAAVLVLRWHPSHRFWGWRIKLPLGVGMHTTHHYRDWSDIVAGVTCEAAIWLLFGTFLFPAMLWMVPLTILVNIVVPFKLRGEGNDAVCLWREQFARMRGFSGITEV
jgi:hypothetical protein